MATKLERYKQLTSRMVEAPSGNTFTLRGLTPAEAMGIIRGLPTFSPDDGATEASNTPVAADPTKETPTERNMRVTKETLIMVCPEISEDGAGDTIPYSSMMLADVNFLMEVVNDLSGLNGPEAAQARRLLPK